MLRRTIRSTAARVHCCARRRALLLRGRSTPPPRLAAVAAMRRALSAHSTLGLRSPFPHAAPFAASPRAGLLHCTHSATRPRLPILLLLRRRLLASHFLRL